MMKNVWLGVLSVVLISISCKRMDENLKITVDSVFISTGVSSGSGLVLREDLIYIVGDDAEYIGKIIKSDTSCSRTPLYENASQNRIERAVKHDLECAAIANIQGEHYLFAFGSGLVSPYRDTMFAINLSDETKTIKRDLQPLYKAIKAKAGLKENELNVEGATISNGQLFLFNRGRNLLIRIEWDRFAKHVLEMADNNIPSFDILPVELPVMNGYPVGFSGACTLNDKELLFTASLEETADFTVDGTVKGSFVGILNVTRDSPADLLFLTEVKDVDGASLSDKLESIDILSSEKNKIKAVAVADNDNGSSKIFYLDIERQ